MQALSLPLLLPEAVSVSLPPLVFLQVGTGLLCVAVEGSLLGV